MNVKEVMDQINDLVEFCEDPKNRAIKSVHEQDELLDGIKEDLIKIRNRIIMLQTHNTFHHD